MNRSLKTRIDKLESLENDTKFELALDGLPEVEQVIGIALSQIVDGRFSETKKQSFATVLCSEVQCLAKQMEPRLSSQVSEEKVTDVSKALIERNTVGVVVFIEPEDERL